MKIIHTADIHLRETSDERWQALLAVVETGQAEDARVMVVSGDLFDADADAGRLRGEVRAVFSDTGMTVLLLPGNHDAQSYGGGAFFGSEARVLGEEPLRIDDVAFAGLPFQDIHAEEVLEKLRHLRKHPEGDGFSILAYHGELLDALPTDTSRADFGREGDRRYMPVRLAHFQALSPDYVLAGHFHSRFERWRLPSGGWFVYPGSPVPVTRRELGPRQVNVFSVGEQPEPRELPTPYYAELRLQLDPFEDSDPLDTIRQRLAALDPHARALLHAGGFVNARQLGLTESELVARIQELAADCAECNVTLRDIGEVLETDLFAEFQSRAEAEIEDADERRDVLQMTLQAMMEVL